MNNRNEREHVRNAPVRERTTVWQEARKTSFRFRLVCHLWALLSFATTVIFIRLCNAQMPGTSAYLSVPIGFAASLLVGFVALHLIVYPELDRALKR